LSITERIDAITKIDPERLSETPPVPKSVKIELTARCDFKCFFCASHQRLRDKADMDFDLFKRLASEMRREGVDELGLFYLGESFMLKWLPDAIHFAKHVCKYPYVFLTTNGRLATPDAVEKAMRAGLDSLKFSFNNSDQEQFAEVTGLPGKHFDTVESNLVAAKAVRDKVEAETGHRCGLYASSIMFDGTQGYRMAKAVERIKPYVDEHYYLPLYNQGALTTQTSQDKGFIPSAGNQGRIGALRKPVPCWSAFTEGHVTFDGQLSACCFDHSASWQMGDLKEVPFKDAWHSDPFRRLRRAHLQEDLAGTPCQACVAYA